MAGLFDLRSKTAVYDGGSSLLSVYLTAAQHEAVTNAAAGTGVAGWYTPSYQESTEVGPERESDEVRDEANNLIKIRNARDEFVLTTTFMQTDDVTLRLLTLLEDASNAVPVRYPMPTNTSGEKQWVFGYNVNVRKEDWRIQIQNNTDRTRQVTFLFSNSEATGKTYEIITLPDDQADAAWADYAIFKDAYAPA